MRKRFAVVVALALGVGSLVFAGGFGSSQGGNVALPVSVANGGTGSSSASTARTALGLAISSDVLPWVAPGSSGNVLTSNGSIWTSAAPASAVLSTVIVSRTTDQTISATTTTDVSFDTEDVDSDNFTNIGGAPTKVLTATGAQVFEVGAGIETSASVAGDQVWLALFNAAGTNLRRSLVVLPTQSGGGAQVSGAFSMASGDYVKVQCYFSGGTTLKQNSLKTIQAWAYRIR